jgi:hypothetical protein
LIDTVGFEAADTRLQKILHDLRTTDHGKSERSASHG